MIWVFLAIGLAAIMMIAIYAISNVTINLAQTDSVSVFDIEEAADFVAERLPPEIDERLDRPMVISIIGWQLEYLRAHGLATFGGVDELAEEAPEAGKGPVVADEDELVDYVLAQALANGVELDALEAVVVLDLTAQYLEAIGAIGPMVEEPLDPEDGVEEPLDPDDGAEEPADPEESG